MEIVDLTQIMPEQSPLLRDILKDVLGIDIDDRREDDYDPNYWLNYREQ